MRRPIAGTARRPKLVDMAPWPVGTAIDALTSPLTQGRRWAKTGWFPSLVCDGRPARPTRRAGGAGRCGVQGSTHFEFDGTFSTF